VENVENYNFFYIMDIFLENSLLLQIKNVFDQIISFLCENMG
jgi:hypothetical protein